MKANKKNTPEALAEAIVAHVENQPEVDLYPNDKIVVLSLTIQQLEDIELALLLHSARHANLQNLVDADKFMALASDIATHNPNR